jgi:hypothetical protein
MFILDTGSGFFPSRIQGSKNTGFRIQIRNTSLRIENTVHRYVDYLSSLEVASISLEATIFKITKVQMNGNPNLNPSLPNAQSTFNHKMRERN